MQKGIIQEVNKVAQEGKKTFYKVKLQDGTVMSTFDPKIEQSESGDRLEFEVTVSGKYVNLKDGFTINKSASSVSPGTSKGNGYPEMSKEEWAEKQRIERDSIEAQVAVKSILNYAAGLLSAGADISDDLGRRTIKALDWCEARIDATMQQPVKETAKTKTRTSKKEKTEPVNPDEVEFDDSPIQNFGDLWTRCDKIGISKEQGLEALGVENQLLIIDMDEAWKSIFDNKFKKGEASAS